MLHQVGDLFELNIKLQAQKVKSQKLFIISGRGEGHEYMPVVKYLNIQITNVSQILTIHKFTLSPVIYMFR